MSDGYTPRIPHTLDSNKAEQQARKDWVDLLREKCIPNTNPPDVLIKEEGGFWDGGFWDRDDPLVKQFEKEEEAFDPVHKPLHYNSHPSGVECITVTEHMGFNLGNAMKYIWRADLKNGIEDLEKALWYINREINKRKVYSIGK